MTTPHKHAAIIHKWADGAQIQFYNSKAWVDTIEPIWDLGTVYRVKPKKVKGWINVYPCNDKHDVALGVFPTREAAKKVAAGDGQQIEIEYEKE